MSARIAFLEEFASAGTPFTAVFAVLRARFAHHTRCISFDYYAKADRLAHDSLCMRRLVQQQRAA